tara:strand:+ start:87 stop:365 length:279 start_codon:yes stop_codon:yes gene_type:complete
MVVIFVILFELESILYIMAFNQIIYNFLNETKEEIKKKENMELLKGEIINPVIKEVINELYPYFIKILCCVIFIVLILILTIILNIRVILMG